MVTSNTYLWKELADNGIFTISRQAEPYKASLEEIDTEFVLSFYDEAMGWDNFINVFFKKYNEVTISSQSKKLIDELLEFNSIKQHKKEFYTLACVFQHTYISLIENPRDLRDSQMRDFQNDSLDLKILLEIIHDNINNILPKVTSISFKGKTANSSYIDHPIPI